ncbi:MAG TPA: dienelactone hydrolase family protein [Candidatus Limnocylindrales bacterium]|nr:dienelactone hydrolase family protein [Candidatus Limnocylindrales bacterium]
MCYPPGARPPDLPEDLRPITGGAGGEDVILTSTDGTTLRAFLSKARSGETGVVIAPDIRGLHRFYEELAERFADAGVHAIAFDYFGRTAGTDKRGDDFPWKDHVPLTKPDTIQMDVAASVEHLKKATGAKRVFVLGFCMGGRVAFNASADQKGLEGVVGFYGRLSTRPGEEGTSPRDRANAMTAPVLALMGGADPGIPETEVRAFEKAMNDAKVNNHVEIYAGAPHSFFDRTFAEHKEACDDAWRRALGFMNTGDPAARA